MWKTLVPSDSDCLKRDEHIGRGTVIKTGGGKAILFAKSKTDGRLPLRLTCRKGVQIHKMSDGAAMNSPKAAIRMALYMEATESLV